MRILPTNDREWTDVLLAPFKTFPIVIFVIATILTPKFEDELTVLYLLLGYFVCLLFVIWVAILDTAVAKSARSYWEWSAAIALLGIVFALKWL